MNNSLIVFTWDDLKRLLKSKQKKIIWGSSALAAMMFCSLLVSPLLFESKATFKLSHSHKAQSLDAKSFIRSLSTAGSEESPVALMLSDAILGKTVESLGLQAELKTTSSRWLSKFNYGLKNVLAEMGIDAKDGPSLRLSSLSYKGRTPLLLTIQRVSDQSYNLFDAKGTFLIQGVIGEIVHRTDFQFSLDDISSLMLLKKSPLILHPLESMTSALREQIFIKPSREDKNLLIIRCRHVNRDLSAEIVNSLMAMYAEYLIEENKNVISAQLVYLNERQEELRSKLDQEIQEHAATLRKNLQAEGFLGIKDELEFVLGSLQTHQLRLNQIELELHQIKSRLLKIPLKAESNSHSLVVHHYCQLLADQVLAVKKLIERAHQKEAITTPPFLDHLVLDHLDTVIEPFNQAVEASKSHPENIDTLKTRQHEVTSIFQDVLHQLVARENSLRESTLWMETFKNDLTGISLETAKRLFDSYSDRFDTLHTELKQLMFMRDHLFDPHFEISTLSNILSDSVSQQLVQRSSDLERELRDDVNRSSKERSRLKTAVMIHKRFLEAHLEQTLQLGKVRVELLKEKISSLYDVIKTVLEQEQQSLKDRIGELKQSMQALPNLWIHENRLKFQSDLTQGIMEGLVHMSEAKNLARYLYQVDSRPLDPAKPPLKFIRPFLLIKLMLTLSLSFLFFAGLYVVRGFIRGFPPSLKTLEAIGASTSGNLSLKSPLEFEDLAEEDLTTLRRIASFLMKKPKNVAAIIGETQTKFFPALTTLLKKHHLKSCVIDCSLGKISSDQDAPGVFQVLYGAAWDTALRSYTSYDFLPIGQSSGETVELLSSSAFHTLIKNLLCHYDHLFLLSQTRIDSLETKAVLTLSESAIMIAETPLDILQPYIFNHAGQKEGGFVTFVEYPVR